MCVCVCCIYAHKDRLIGLALFEVRAMQPCNNYHGLGLITQLGSDVVISVRNNVCMSTADRHSTYPAHPPLPSGTP